jgi:predicted transcriptional regulator
MSKEEKFREAEEGEEEKEGEFEVLAEWTVRRLRPLEEEAEEDYTEKAKRWVLYSLGLDKLHQDIFLYLEKKLRTTTTEIATEFNISPNTARKYLDELHTVGLVDYVGREYTLTYESLSRAIELMLIPRITDTLRIIARGASTTDFSVYPLPPGRPVRPTRAEYGEIYEEKGITRVNRKLLEDWHRVGKRVYIKSYSGLTIDDDIDPNLFDAIVERIDCYGGLKVPSSIYGAISHKFRVYGHVDVY